MSVIVACREIVGPVPEVEHLQRTFERVCHLQEEAVEHRWRSFVETEVVVICMDHGGGIVEGAQRDEQAADEHRDRRG